METEHIEVDMTDKSPKEALEEIRAQINKMVPKGDRKRMMELVEKDFKRHLETIELNKLGKKYRDESFKAKLEILHAFLYGLTDNQIELVAFVRVLEDFDEKYRDSNKVADKLMGLFANAMKPKTKDEQRYIA